MWNDKAKNLLLYWRRQYDYQFSFIADVLSRELNQRYTKNACIGMYRRLEANHTPINYSHIKEYLPGKNDPV